MLAWAAWPGSTYFRRDDAARTACEAVWSRLLPRFDDAVTFLADQGGAAVTFLADQGRAAVTFQGGAAVTFLADQGGAAVTFLAKRLGRSCRYFCCDFLSSSSLAL